jgi:hypothetical protein
LSKRGSGYFWQVLMLRDCENLLLGQPGHLGWVLPRPVCCIAQTRHPAIRYESVREMAGNSAVLTSAECRTQAEAMLAQAERDHEHRRRLTIAAQAFPNSPHFRMIQHAPASQLWRR